MHAQRKKNRKQELHDFSTNFAGTSEKTTEVQGQEAHCYQENTIIANEFGSLMKTYSKKLQEENKLFSF